MSTTSYVVANNCSLHVLETMEEEDGTVTATFTPIIAWRVDVSIEGNPDCVGSTRTTAYPITPDYEVDEAIAKSIDQGTKDTAILYPDGTVRTWCHTWPNTKSWLDELQTDKSK